MASSSPCVGTSDVVTKDLIQNALRHAKQREDIIVKNISVQPGSEEGDNFASVTLAVRAVAQMGEKQITEHLFIKTARKEGFAHELNKNRINIFTKETYAYTDVIQAMLHLQSEKGLESTMPSVPKHYFSIVGKDRGTIILENLIPQGYKLANKNNLMDKVHSSLALKELARFHALSFALKKVNLQNMKKIDVALEEVVFQAPFPSFLMTSFKTLLSFVKSFTNDTTIITAAEKLRTMDLETLVLNKLKPEEPYALICHGDFWMNNILFKYEATLDGTSIVDAKIFDLQCMRYAPLATDLAYFVYMSTTRTMRKEHLGELLAVYHQSFHQALKRLKLDFPEFTHSVLEQQFKKSMLFGVTISCIFTFAMMAKPDENRDFTKEQDEQQLDEYRTSLTKKTFSNEENRYQFRERIIGAIEEAVEMGEL